MDYYKKLGIKKRTAQPGDLLSASKFGQVPSRVLPTQPPKMKKRTASVSKSESKEQKMHANKNVKPGLKNKKRDAHEAKEVALIKPLAKMHGLRKKHRGSPVKGPFFGGGHGSKKRVAKKLPKLGSGKRFANLTKKLQGKKGVYDPAGLAASIGRKKFGAKKMQAMASAGKKKRSEKTKSNEKGYKVKVKFRGKKKVARGSEC